MALWFTIIRQDFATEAGVPASFSPACWGWCNQPFVKRKIHVQVGHCLFLLLIFMDNSCWSPPECVLHISPNEAWWNSRNCCCWTPRFCCQNTQVCYREIWINPHVCCLNSHLGRLHLHVIHILVGDIGNYRYVYGDGSFFLDSGHQRCPF